MALTTAEIPDWNRKPLSDEDRRRIELAGWRGFPVELTIAVAEAWNAEMHANEIAEDLGQRRGEILTLLRSLRKLGVTLRTRDKRPRGAPRSPPVRTNRAPPPPRPRGAPVDLIERAVQRRLMAGGGL